MAGNKRIGALLLIKKREEHLRAGIDCAKDNASAASIALGYCFGLLF
jgi:hypothetical protein